MTRHRTTLPAIQLCIAHYIMVHTVVFMRPKSWAVLCCNWRLRGAATCNLCYLSMVHVHISSIFGTLQWWGQCYCMQLFTKSYVIASVFQYTVCPIVHIGTTFSTICKICCQNVQHIFWIYIHIWWCFYLWYGINIDECHK